MRVKFIIAVALCTFLCSLSNLAHASFDKPDEIVPNMPVDFDFGIANSFIFSEEFPIPRDKDFYKLVIPRRAYLDIEVLGQVNSKIELLDSNENIIALDIENGEESNARLVYEIEEAGIYYIKLSNENEVRGIYDLEVSLIDLNELTDDYNNELLNES